MERRLGAASVPAVFPANHDAVSGGGRRGGSITRSGARGQVQQCDGVHASSYICHHLFFFDAHATPLLSPCSLASPTRAVVSYASSPLAKVQVKVEAVRDVMQNSVARALSSVENLEDMDEKAELFEDKSKTFYKRTEAVKVQERSKYRKLTCLLATLIIAIIAYFVITAVVKYRFVPCPRCCCSAVRRGAAGAGASAAVLTGSASLWLLSLCFVVRLFRPSLA